MTKHTPGPWAAHSDTGYRWSVKDAKGRDVVPCVYGYPHDDDHARLIAAAPDLLAALESSFSFLDDGTPDNDRSDEETRVLRQARAAIAKATQP